MQLRSVHLLALAAFTAAPAHADPGVFDIPAEPPPAEPPPAQPGWDIPMEEPTASPPILEAPEPPVADPPAPEVLVPEALVPEMQAPEAAVPPPPERIGVAGVALYSNRAPARSALLLRGFDVTWDSRPHRLRTLAFAATGGSDEPTAPPTGQLVAAVEGGAWASGERATDTPVARVDYTGLASRRAPILRGTVHTRVEGRSRILGADQPATGTFTVEVPLPEAAGWDGAAVFLDGFALSADGGHPNGYTPHTIAVQLGPATVEGGVARFDVDVEVQAAAVPDRDQHLGEYGAEVEVGWVVVPAAADRVHRLSAEGGAGHGIEVEAALTSAMPVSLPLQTATNADTSAVAVGLSGFRLAIDESGLDAGRYLRAITVSVDPGSIDPFTHRWEGDVALRFANAGVVTRATGVSLEADVTVLELDSNERAWTGRWSTIVTDTVARQRYPEELVRGTK